MPILKANNSNGFTLIELLVVISIIGLLASVVLVSLNSARQKSRNAKRLADVNQIAKGLEIFYNQASAYPTGTVYVCGTAGCGGAVMGSGVLSAQINGQTTNLTPTYMSSIPASPTPADGTCSATGFQGNPYYYEVNSSGSSYTLTFCLGQATGSYQAGVKFLTPSGVR